MIESTLSGVTFIYRSSGIIVCMKYPFGCTKWNRLQIWLPNIFAISGFYCIFAADIKTLSEDDDSKHFDV